MTTTSPPAISPEPPQRLRRTWFARLTQLDAKAAVEGLDEHEAAAFASS